MERAAEEPQAGAEVKGRDSGAPLSAASAYAEKAASRRLTDEGSRFGRRRDYPSRVTAADDIIIRRARSGDAAQLQAILHDTFASTWQPNISDAAAAAFVREDRPAAYVGARGLLFRVAEVDGEVAGFVDWDGDFVNALHVRSSHARMGLGRRLMDLAEAQIAGAGFASARLETDTFNARSRAFYAARSYREVDRYPDEEWDSGLTTLLLVKPLR